MMLKQRPGHFFSQMMAQKVPNEKMPLMAVNTINNHAFCKASSGGITPSEGPLHFALYSRHSLDHNTYAVF
jgi:hypothetical protein